MRVQLRLQSRDLTFQRAQATSTSARLKHGLHWPTHRRPFPLVAVRKAVTTIAVIGGLLTAYGFVDANDRAIEAELAARVAEGWLLDCLNGTFRAAGTDGTIVVCDKWER